MSGWAIAVGLALAVLGAAILLLRLPRRSWEALAAALVFGLAGYALQGSPSAPGAPKTPVEEVGGKAPSRKDDLGGKPISGDPWVVTANALYRHGQYADAANYLRGALKANQGNAEAWLVTANSIVAHAEGNVTPAALYAFERAMKAAPNHPAPPFFLGLALAQSGRLSEGRAIWADLLARSPKDAPWRPEIEAKLADLDSFIERQQSQGVAP